MAIPPSVGAFDAPTTQFEINDEWLTHLFELVGRAARLSFWDGADAQQLHAQRQIEAIITAMMTGNIRQVVGEIKIHAREDLPEGWLWCDGHTYNRVDWPELYEALHPNFRVNADTFKVPDMQLRFPLGFAEGSPSFVGLQGGEQSHQLTQSEMPVHNHPPATTGQAFVTQPPAGQTTGLRINGVAASGFYIQPAGGQTTGQSGGNTPHNNMPVYTWVYYAIVGRSGNAD